MADKPLIWAVSSFDGGLVSSHPDHTIPGDASPDTENYDPSENGKLKKRGGTTNFSGDNGSATGTIVRGLYCFSLESGSAFIMAKEGTAVYDISAGNWSTTVTGHPALGDGDEVHFATFKNVLIMTSEESSPIAPQKWSGSGTFSNLGGSPPSAKYPCVHRSRLWLACTSADPSRVYFSAINNHEDWSTADDAGNFYVNPGDGMVINAMASDGDVLYVSKINNTSHEGAMYAVFGNTPNDFQVRRIAYFGAVSQRAFKATQSFVVAACQRGVYGFQGSRAIYMSGAVEDAWEGLTNAQRLVAAVGVYKTQVWVAYPASGSTNTKALVFDLYNQRINRYNPTTARIFAEHPDGSLYSGWAVASTVRVAKHDQGTSDIGTVAIAAYWDTPNIDFGQWWVDKMVHQGFLFAKSQNVSYSVTYSVDNASVSDTTTINPSTAGIVTRFIPKKSVDTEGRLWKFRVAESSTSASEFYGLQLEAESRPRLR